MTDHKASVVDQRTVVDFQRDRINKIPVQTEEDLHGNPRETKVSPGLRPFGVPKL